MLDVGEHLSLTSRCKPIVLPPLLDDDIQYSATEQGVGVGDTHAARELHSTRDGVMLHGTAEHGVVEGGAQAARELHSTRNDCSDHTGYSGYSVPSLEDATYNLGRAASAFSSSRVCNAHLTLSACYWSCGGDHFLLLQLLRLLSPI